MSAKVTVIARIVARPDTAGEVEAALCTLVDGAADEAGTVEYVLHREGDSAAYWLYELYADQAAFDAHGRNPVLAEAFGRIGRLLAEPPELHILTPLQAKDMAL